jgi:serine/threonine protein kinase
MLDNGRSVPLLTSLIIFIFSSEVERYFAASRVIFERSEDTEGNLSVTLVYPKKTSLRHRLQLSRDDLLTNDETKFLEFVGWMLQLDPEKRPLAGEALLHPWFDDVDLNDVSYVDT